MTTLRLTDSLRLEATRYARTLGISLNALVAVALRDYLDARKGQDAIPSTPAPVAVVRLPSPPPASAKPVYKAGRNDPCPCGSGRKFKVCHGGPGGAL